MSLKDLRNDENKTVENTVRNILNEIKVNGDEAVLKYAQQFDSFSGESFKADKSLLEKSLSECDEKSLKAFAEVKTNIELFNTKLLPENLNYTNPQGVEIGVINKPFQRVAIYIPAGTAPLVSTLFMLAIPAKIAGVKEIVLLSPAAAPEKIDTKILAAAEYLGVSEVYCLGGIQGIGAAAYGTESINKVEKIFGPGNQYVDWAKKLVSREVDGPAIDLEAGPSEVLVIADEKANPNFIAADLLAQLEHDTIAQAVLLCTNKIVIEKSLEAVKDQTSRLSRQEILDASLRNLRTKKVKDLQEAIELSNEYAPEHLILQTENASELLFEVQNAGSVFVGAYTPETLGDYMSGTNHVLPTQGQAKKRGGVSVMDFLKKMTYQKASKKSLDASYKSLKTLCDIEGLDGHLNAVEVRLGDL